MRSLSRFSDYDLFAYFSTGIVAFAVIDILASRIYETHGGSIRHHEDIPVQTGRFLVTATPLFDHMEVQQWKFTSLTSAAGT